MAIEIGSKGLVEVNLTIPQGTSLDFTIEHKDEEGNAVDHTASTVKMAFQDKAGETLDLSSCCAGTATGVSVAIPASVTSELAKGKLVWDMIATTSAGSAFRLAYGSVAVVDTYALDE